MINYSSKNVFTWNSEFSITVHFLYTSNLDFFWNIIITVKFYVRVQRIGVINNIRLNKWNINLLLNNYNLYQNSLIINFLPPPPPQKIIKIYLSKLCPITDASSDRDVNTRSAVPLPGLVTCFRTLKY